MIGIVPGKDYLPTIELMRFMTPFGVGYYSQNDDSLSSKRRPVYIPNGNSVYSGNRILPICTRLLQEKFM